MSNRLFKYILLFHETCKTLQGCFGKNTNMLKYIFLHILNVIKENSAWIKCLLSWEQRELTLKIYCSLKKTNICGSFN